MKVEHLTVLSNNSTIRDTTDIALKTLDHFGAFQVEKGRIEVNIKLTELSVKATVAEGMAIFDIYKGDTILFCNVCCFDRSDTESAMGYVKNLAENTIFQMFGKGIIRKPTEGMFLYTIPVNPFVLPDDAKLAGEIEFYIYYSLYLGRNKKQKKATQSGGFFV